MEAELQHCVYSDRELQLLLREVEDVIQTGAPSARALAARSLLDPSVPPLGGKKSLSQT